jgi:hypothetical protein
MLTRRVAIGGALLANACSGGRIDIPGEAIVGIRVSIGGFTGSKTVIMNHGDVVGIIVYPMSAAGVPIDTIVPVTFASRHPNAVTVDSKGIVTAVADGVSFVVASLSSDGHTYRDSVTVVVTTIIPLGVP